MSFSHKMIAAVIVGLALSVAPSISNAAPQDRQDEKKSGSTFMSPRTYNRINNATKAMDEGKYQEALEDLNALAEDVKDSPYELAVTLQTIAYVYIGQEDYERAAQYFERALALKAMPEEPEKGIIYALAQIYGVLGQFEKTVALMTDWLKTAKNPPADAYITLANAQYVLERYTEAYAAVKQALAKMDKPREEWLKLALGVQYELKKYREAAGTLEILVANWPDKKDYWRQLSGIYIELKDDQKALAAMAMAYERGVLEKPEELLNLTRLYLLNEVPFRGAQVLEKAFAEEKVEENRKNYELLAHAWIQAREFKKGIAALNKAASYSEDGDLYVRAAQLEMSMANWEGAKSSARKALEKGGLESKQTGQAWLLLGTAAAEGKDFDTAINAFEKARGYPETRQSASQWLSFVQTEKQVSTLN